MVDSCVKVKISQKNSCAFEESSKNVKGESLASLIESLKDIQQKTNAFLSTLVETRVAQHDVPTDVHEQSDVSDSDSDELTTESEVEVNPKKCKLTN